MPYRIRFIIFVIFVLVYLVLAPTLVLYSLGYRFDFENRRIVSTGGLDLKIWPQDALVSIDSKKPQMAGMFSNEIFLQGLMPKNYTILVESDGYFSWTKTLPVKEKEVTEIPNVTLVKKNIIFESFSSGLSGFFISPDNKKTLLAEALDKTTKLSVVELATKNQLGSAVLPFQNFDVLWSKDSNKILISDTRGKYFVFDYLITQSSAIKPVLSEEKNVSAVSFNPLDSNELFFAKSNALYSNNQPDKSIINGLLAYQIYANKIIWLSGTGMLYSSDISGNITDVLTTKPIDITANLSFSITAGPQIIFLKRQKNLLFLDQKTATLRDFYTPVNDFGLSPDNKRILYFSDHELLFSNLSGLPERNSIVSFPEKIINCFWLNNDYIIIKTESKIKVSEIDTRDKVNIITLPQQISLSDGTITILNNPEIFFNQNNKKLYILNEGNLLVSERLTQ